MFSTQKEKINELLVGISVNIMDVTVKPQILQYSQYRSYYKISLG